MRARTEYNPVKRENRVKITLPNVSERRQVHIINPAACAGKHAEIAKKVAGETGNEVIVTEYAGQMREITAELFTKDRFAHAVVYGGDGTINEAVNGIMDSGNNLTASFSVMPFGSGNDFSHFANDSGEYNKSELTRIDLGKANGRYFVNMLNIGFDANVVYRAGEMKKKPGYNGDAAYIKGVIAELIHKKPIDAEITLDSGEKKRMQLLLTACANGRYCGGGFKAAPIADLQDGMLDVLLINDISRLKFLSLVSDYRLGTYMDENGNMLEKFRDVIRYEKCRSYSVEGIDRYCIDGEIIEDSQVNVEAVKDAVWFAAI